MEQMRMNSLQCQYLRTLARNVFTHRRKKNLTLVSPVASHLWCTKRLNSNDQTVVPVKLAYASYETMNESEGAPKQPVMIMHGLFGSKNNWNSLSKPIHQKTQRKVITVDARNHGDSPHSADMSYRHMAQDVVELLKDLGLKKSVLVGHSMGGSAMMYVALNYPELVEKLIVVDMSPVRTSPSLAGMANIFKAMRSVTLNGCTTLTKARRVASEQLESAIQSLALRQFLMMNLVEAEAGQFKWRVNLPVLEDNFLKKLAVFPNVGSKVYTGPTLFIGGGNSDYLPKKDHPAIKKLFPTAEFHYIAGANHWVHADKPAEFLNILINFVNQTHT